MTTSRLTERNASPMNIGQRELDRQPAMSFSTFWRCCCARDGDRPLNGISFRGCFVRTLSNAPSSFSTTGNI